MRSDRKKMVQAPGLEPGLPVPETGVLTLTLCPDWWAARESNSPSAMHDSFTASLRSQSDYSPFLISWWRRWESNPRPKIHPATRLQACPEATFIVEQPPSGGPLRRLSQKRLSTRAVGAAQVPSPSSDALLHHSGDGGRTGRLPAYAGLGSHRQLIRSAIWRL